MEIGEDLKKSINHGVWIMQALAAAVVLGSAVGGAYWWFSN